jgi:hypothetical protein
MPKPLWPTSPPASKRTQCFASPEIQPRVHDLQEEAAVESGRGFSTMGHIAIEEVSIFCGTSAFHFFMLAP